LRGAVAKNPLALPALVEPAGELLWQIEPHLAALERQLNEVRALEVPLQPCLRDIWHDHVLFVGDRVSGLVDLGSMSFESVAADVARLLGSLCGNDKRSWSVGMAAYEALRPLSEDERKLVAAFDRSNTLLAGVKWVEWVFVERRRFADPTAVLRRMEHILDRLAGIYQDE
jgi:Ser/Thr protein kinase RdoA (MazF antagonist)